jgi:hypothetical protein
MPVKHWSSAGLLLTYRCNAQCECCYLCCSPRRTEEMTVESALTIWEELQVASPHGCRVHLTGGEPFLNWPRLIEICRAAHKAGLGPLEKIETNAFWADSADAVRDRLRQLDEAGMQKLSISADPYHQQFVPIERVRLAAATAREVLGPARVQVRWEDWLAEGFDTSGMGAGERKKTRDCPHFRPPKMGAVPSFSDAAGIPEDERRALFLQYASQGRDRLSGRAADSLAPLLELKPPGSFADKSCREAILRSRHVHVDPAGRVFPGTCAGLELGSCGTRTAGEIWRDLEGDFASRPVVGRLARGGPLALLEEARRAGMAPRAGYAGKCHLCWDVRRFFVGRGMHAGEIGPGWMYGQEVV